MKKALRQRDSLSEGFKRSIKMLEFGGMSHEKYTSYNGIYSIDHQIEVPLDYDSPSEAKISVFAREVGSLEDRSKNLPCLLYLQGGPGFESPRPFFLSSGLKEALKHYRLILLDQRGTGLSQPITPHSLKLISGPEAQARYLSNFRADNIVRDAEELRCKLIGDQKWSILGQSYGGFCSFTYLSFFPDSLREVFVTGGVPPIGQNIDEVYRYCSKKLKEKTME